MKPDDLRRLGAIRPENPHRPRLRPEEAAPYRAPDTVDRAIDQAREENRPVRLEEAFPEPAPPLLAEDEQYRREHQLRLVHRLVLRGLNTESIANHLGISKHQVAAMKREIRTRLRAESLRFDAHSYLGRTRAYYQEIVHASLRDADTAKKAEERAAARRVALAALADEYKLLLTSGVLPQALLRAKEEQAGEQGDPYAQQAKKIITLIQSIASDSYDVVLDEETEPGEDFDLLG